MICKTIENYTQKSANKLYFNKYLEFIQKVGIDLLLSTFIL